MNIFCYEKKKKENVAVIFSSFFYNKNIQEFADKSDIAMAKMIKFTCYFAYSTCYMYVIILFILFWST